MSLNDLYQKTILDHYKNPRHYGTIENCRINASEENPICGDQVHLMMVVNEDKIIEKVRFTAKGCALSIASASLMCELIEKQSLEDTRELSRQIFKIFKERQGVERLDHYGELKALSGVLDYPVRIKCVLLCWQALESALNFESPK